MRGCDVRKKDSKSKESSKKIRNKILFVVKKMCGIFIFFYHKDLSEKFLVVKNLSFQEVSLWFDLLNCVFRSKIKERKMGGNALKKGLTERKNKIEYFQIKEKLLNQIKQINNLFFQIIEVIEIPEKEEFGDLDLLYYHLNTSNQTTTITTTTTSTSTTITTPTRREEMIEFIQNNFHPNEIIELGNILSFDFERFQIDFIECSSSNFELSKFCLSYSDRGMILGQIARWYGYSFGYNGLIILSEDIERIIGFKGITEKIILSLDPLEISQFMGLPLSDEMIKGRNDVGLFCKISPWFRPEQFTNKLNADGRKRWAKRPYYRYFVEQIIAEVHFHYNSLESCEENNNNNEEEEINQKKVKYPNHLYHFIDPSFEVRQFEGLNSIHSDYNHYTHTSDSDHQTIRELHIHSALNYFHKWNEIEIIRQKYTQLHEMKEKLNYNLFLELGIHSNSLLNARLDFLNWLLSSRRGVEITEENRTMYERELLQNETNDSIQAKLNEWYQLKNENNDNDDNNNNNEI